MADPENSFHGSLLFISIGFYVIFFSVIFYLKFDSFSYGDYDLAYFDQIIRNFLQGSVFSSILGCQGAQ